MTHDSWCRRLAGPQMTEVSECSSPVLALVSVLQYQATPAPPAQTSYCKTHICTLTLGGSSLQTLNIYTDIWYTDSGWWTQSTSWWTFFMFLWFWSRGWAKLTFKSHAIVYEWIKNILYSAYNCANAARRLPHLWEALLWFRWVDAACSGEHWGRCEHWALQSLVSNMGDNFGI